MAKNVQKKERYTAVLKIIKVTDFVVVDDYNGTVEKANSIDTELASFTVRHNSLPSLLAQAQLHLDRIEDLD